LGPLLFLLYINDLPHALLYKATPILFADDTNLIITGKNTSSLQEDINVMFGQISQWFQDNCLSLNISETNFMQFSNKASNYNDLNITYENTSITTVKETKFVELNINNTLSWTTHIDKIIPKLCSACFAVRSVRPFVSQQMLRMIYFSYFHSIMSYGMIFWGHSSYSVQVFRLQKRIIRIMTASRSAVSCRSLFINLKILPLPSLYIFFLLRFVIKNEDLFSTNIDIHKIQTRHCYDLHIPPTNSRKYQTAVFYMCIKLYNSLPSYIKAESNNSMTFLSILHTFLSENSFYLIGTVL